MKSTVIYIVSIWFAYFFHKGLAECPFKYNDILTMGNLPHNNMMIITKDYHLYHLKLTNEFQAHELSRSQSLKVEWPKLVNDPNFSKVKKNVLHSVFIADSIGEYFLMITKEQCQCLGLIYDIGRKEVKQGFQFTDSESAVMISTDKVFDLFMVMNDYMGQMMIMRYQFNNPTITRSNQIKPEKLGSFYRVCKWDFERIQLIQNTVSSCVPIKWKIQNGFFSNGYFYLFDNEQQVYIFSEKIYSQVIVQYQQTSFERFINCNISGRNIVEKKTSNGEMCLYLWIKVITFVFQVKILSLLSSFCLHV